MQTKTTDYSKKRGRKAREGERFNEEKRVVRIMENETYNVAVYSPSSPLSAARMPFGSVV